MGSYPWIIGGVVAGGIIHILCVLGIPALAERDAWSRLSATMKPNTLVVSDGKSGVGLPFSPPDVISAYCLFDISERNVVVRSPLNDGPWSLAVSSPSGENFYLVTGADAKKSEARLLLIRRDRLSEEFGDGKDGGGRGPEYRRFAKRDRIHCDPRPSPGGKFPGASLERAQKSTLRRPAFGAGCRRGRRAARCRSQEQRRRYARAIQAAQDALSKLPADCHPGQAKSEPGSQKCQVS